MQHISASQLATRIQQEELLLLDVREPWEYDICHIGGSVNIPMGQIPAQLEQLQAKGDIIVICHHGIRSQRVIQFLHQQAFESLVNLDGGVDAWAREIDPDMPVY